MRKVLFILGLVVATPAWGETCSVGEYLNGDTCTPIDIGYYGVNCAESPAGYTRLEYLESTYTQYIDTGVLIDKSSIRATIDFQFAKATSNNWFAGAIHRGLLGVEAGSHSSVVFYTSNGFSYSSGKILERQIATMTVSESNISNLNLYIFARNGKNLSPNYSYTKIFSTQIYDNDTMIRNFIPVQRNSDLRLGMYDLVHNQFYLNLGTGHFVPGPPFDCATQTQCPPGVYCVNGVHIYCPIGKYVDIYGAVKCIDCKNTIPENSSYSTAGWTTSECPWVCNDGYLQTDENMCRALCAAGATSLRTGTGVNVPLFATRNTTPSINVGIGNNVCYVDLVSGTATGAINVQYDGKTYHTVAQ